jgi:hypothetical protein
LIQPLQGALVRPRYRYVPRPYRIHRVEGEPNPETEFRHYALDEEFSERDKRDDQPA